MDSFQAFHDFLLPFPEISQGLIKHIAFPKRWHVTGPNPKVLAALPRPKHTVLQRSFVRRGTKAEPVNWAHQAAPLLHLRIDSTAIDFTDLRSEICSSQATHLNTSGHFLSRAWEITSLEKRLTSFLHPEDLFELIAIRFLSMPFHVAMQSSQLERATAAQLQPFSDCLCSLEQRFVNSSPLSHASWLRFPWQTTHALFAGRGRIS